MAAGGKPPRRLAWIGAAAVAAAAVLILAGWGDGRLELVADNGFRPEQNGFSFENYGGDAGATDLTPAEMVTLFGDGVCASTAGGQCLLTPQAEQWMLNENREMAGGHCYGFSVASLSFFKNLSNPSGFGASTVPALAFPGNQPIQRYIAYGMVHQMLDSVRDGTIKGTPSEILDRLISVLRPGASELYTIGIFKRNGTGGHAVTPYAVQDKGGGQFSILVYDNNYPSQQREIAIDRNANTWSYNAAINPSVAPELYDGDAATKTLDLTPMTVGFGVQPCPFCGNVGSSTSDERVGSAAAYDEIFLEGNPRNHAHLLIVDRLGQRLGYVGSTFVSEIPGAHVLPVMAFDDFNESDEPVYEIPTGLHVTITIDGSLLTKPDVEDVSVIGRGADVEIDGIRLAPGQKDVLRLPSEESALYYTTAAGQRESPTIRLGVQQPTIRLGVQQQEADHAFTVKALALPPRATIVTKLDIRNNSFVLRTTGSSRAGTYAIGMERETTKGAQFFKHPGLRLRPAETAVLAYGPWTHHGQPMRLITTYQGKHRFQSFADRG